jgi:hypothetical protein
MKLTKSSKLLKQFIENTCESSFKLNKTTLHILRQLYDDILDADNNLQTLKKTNGNQFFYHVQIIKINNYKQITKPSNFNSHYFPESVRKHIDEFSTYSLVYTFITTDKRKITVNLTIEENDPSIFLNTYNKYIEYIYMWIHIMNTYSSKQCSQDLTIYLFFTSLNKILPDNHIEILDVHNVNTAFTSGCLNVSEIVIYRKEEWFKVLLHESFHNFGLDFSDMNNGKLNAKILQLFPVNSQVNLFESYCEFWAELMNVLFCSFSMLKDKNDFETFIKNFHHFINLEINYSTFQLVKILNYMGLNYESLHSTKPYAKTLRDNLYKENTNVLSYYVIKLILIVNFQSFLSWCDTHNTSLLQFNKTIHNQNEIYNFIEKHYKNNKLLTQIDCMQDIFTTLLKTYYKKSNNKMNFIMSNLRMSLCEMG